MADAPGFAWRLNTLKVRALPLLQKNKIMMTFAIAVGAARDKKKIARESWTDGSYLEYIEDDMPYLKKTVNGVTIKWYATLDDSKATDWIEIR